MSVPKPLTHNVNDALWHACRLGNEDAVKWALGLEVGEGQLYYAEEFWEVRKLEGYLTKEKGYDRNYSPAFGQTAAHIASLEGHRSILENYLFTADGGWSRTKPDSNGQTPADLAFLGGYPDLADWIRGLQAPPSNLHALLMQKTIEDCDKITLWILYQNERCYEYVFSHASRFIRFVYPTGERYLLYRERNGKGDGSRDEKNDWARHAAGTA